MRFMLAMIVCLVACGDKEPNVAAARVYAVARCERLASCYAAIGNGTPVDTTCDYDTVHVTERCGIGCIEALWEEHDGRTDGGQPLPSACRCASGADCGETRACNESGACVPRLD